MIGNMGRTDGVWSSPDHSVSDVADARVGGVPGRGDGRGGNHRVVTRCQAVIDGSRLSVCGGANAEAATAYLGAQVHGGAWSRRKICALAANLSWRLCFGVC